MVFTKSKQSVTRIIGSDGLKPRSIQDVIAETLRHHPDAETDYLRKAFEHAGRVRRLEKSLDNTREQYCLNTAFMLAANKLDLESIAASLLQDVLPANASRRPGLVNRFGEEQASILDGLASIATITFRGRGKNQPENFRRFIEAISIDVRVLIVALANQCQIMRRLDNLSATDRKQRCVEAQDIYAPLATRIGMNPFKTELEELAFYFMEPEAYREIEEQRTVRHRRNRKFLAETQTSLQDLLKNRGVEAEIHSRVKHHYSIYKKIRDKNRNIEGIYDYYAYRVLTDSVSSCYRCFGMFHNQWRHIPGRIKDFIATPKNNLYQALHTTLISQDGTPFEVQIKTHMMHHLAELGVTAHWTYKHGRLALTGNQNVATDFAGLLADGQDIPDNAAFVETIRGQLNTDEIIVFTPKSDLKTLPKGSTALDFAYLIHTDLGHRAASAIVDGRATPLRNQLPSGCIVEVVTDPNQNPSRDWLDFVKTNAARSKIRAWLRKTEKETALAEGREQLTSALGKFETDLDSIAELDRQNALQRLGLKTMTDLYAAIGFGRLTAARAAQPFLPQDAQQTMISAAEDPIDGEALIAGRGDNILSFARCCNPIPGDDVIGFITKRTNLSVHQADCNALRRICMNPERLVELTWNTNRPEKLFQTKLKIQTTDRPSMIAEITRLFADSGINVLELNVKQDPDSTMKSFDFIFEVTSSSTLKKITHNLEKIKGVKNVERI